MMEALNFCDRILLRGNTNFIFSHSHVCQERDYFYDDGIYSIEVKLSVLSDNANVKNSHLFTHFLQQ